MNPVILFWSIPLLTIAALFLTFYGQQLYLKGYERHILFEPSSQYRVPFGLMAAQFFILFIVFILGPAFLWVQGQNNSSEFLFLCGFAIAFFAGFVSRALAAILVYSYFQKNPQLVSGQTIFKSPAVHAISAGIVLQQLILIAILAFFIPSNIFIIGAFCGLVALFATHLSARNRKPLTF